jgi:hypothetical protein
VRNNALTKKGLSTVRLNKKVHREQPDQAPRSLIKPTPFQVDLAQRVLNMAVSSPFQRTQVTDGLVGPAKEILRLALTIPGVGADT